MTQIKLPINQKYYCHAITWCDGSCKRYLTICASLAEAKIQVLTYPSRMDARVVFVDANIVEEV
jgi:hypothetical protein